jgi:hypothetical protein
VHATQLNSSEGGARRSFGKLGSGARVRHRLVPAVASLRSHAPAASDFPHRAKIFLSSPFPSDFPHRAKSSSPLRTRRSKASLLRRGGAQALDGEAGFPLPPAGSGGCGLAGFTLSFWRTSQLLFCRLKWQTRENIHITKNQRAKATGKLETPNIGQTQTMTLQTIYASEATILNHHLITSYQ